jgi:hydroxymethylpyrimidine pyrophosphatase-like HAD family hydrolase
MRFLSDYFSVPRERSIAMGDSDNDLLMLGEAGIAVAMGNACEKVKAIADFETLDCDDGGVGYAINKLLFEREEN